MNPCFWKHIPIFKNFIIIIIKPKTILYYSSKNHHFFFFFGFLIFILASGKGILNPSSAGSVILLMFLIILTFLFPYLFIYSFKASIFSSVMFGVKLIISCFNAPGFSVFNCYKKWSLSRSRLLASRNYKFGHFFTSWNNWSETLVKPPTLRIFMCG